MAAGKHILGKSNARRVFGTAKVGDRGQIVIPKEAREMFGIQPGDTIVILGDEKRGLAIPLKEMFADFTAAVFESELRENK